LVLALGTKITGDAFTAGKWISILSAAGVALCSFLLFARAFGYWAGIGTALLVIVSGEFPMFAISATTDVFFLLLCLACIVSLTVDRLSPAWRMWIGGSSCRLRLPHSLQWRVSDGGGADRHSRHKHFRC
jgi:hypothetical protein